MTSKWTRWRLKSPASRLFTQPFVQTQIKENIKALRHWPLWGNSLVTGEFPSRRASNTENVSIWWRHHELIKLGLMAFSAPHDRKQYIENWVQNKKTFVQVSKWSVIDTLGVLTLFFFKYARSVWYSLRPNLQTDVYLQLTLDHQRIFNTNSKSVNPYINKWSWHYQLCCRRHLFKETFDITWDIGDIGRKNISFMANSYCD